MCIKSDQTNMFSKSKAILEAHQEEGVQWLLNREKSKPRGGILCDEMGLGKTVQMLDLMARNPKKHTLIVVPKSIVNQWKTEIEKFVPWMTVCVYNGSKRKFVQSDICICPYSVVVDLVDVLWNRVILDEGHEIRSPTSLLHKNCMRIKSEIKWILTGTPVFNTLRDFVSLCGFIGIPRKRVQAYSEEIHKEFLLRRVKSDLMSCTVPCDFQNIELEMYPDEKKLYDEVYDQLFEYENVLEGLLYCKQVCTWPQLYYDSMHKKFGGDRVRWTGSTAKMDSLICLIKRHTDEKTLVFTQFVGEAIEIQKRLQKIGRDTFILDGQTTDRDVIIEKFKRSSDEGAVFIIQIKTGGVGLNLQEATRVYITQPAWNPATEMQAIARSHRTGQSKPVVVRKLVYTDEASIENEIVELQGAKSKLCAHVLCDARVKSQVPNTTKASNFALRIGKKLYDIE